MSSKPDVTVRKSDLTRSCGRGRLALNFAGPSESGGEDVCERKARSSSEAQASGMVIRDCKARKPDRSDWQGGRTEQRRCTDLKVLFQA